MTLKYKRWDLVGVLLFLIACWAYLNFGVRYEIIFKEQMGMFMMSSESIALYLAKPAILTEIVGEFLTQFFAIDALGPVLFTLAFGLIWLGLNKAFRRIGLGDASSTLALIPLVLELVSVTSQAYTFSTTLGLLVAVWVFVACSYVKNEKVLLGVYLVALPLVYLLAGSHMITALILFLMLRRRNILPALGVGVAALLIELFIGRHMGLDLVQTLYYPLNIRYPLSPVSIYMLVPASVLAMALLGLLDFRPWIGYLMALAALGLGLKFSYRPSENYDLKVATLAYRNQWSEVKKLAIENPYNTVIGIYYRNLCFAKEGKLVENLLEYGSQPYGALQFSVASNSGYLPIFCAIDQLLEVGDISQATDCALLIQTVMPRNNSSRMIRTLAVIALTVADDDVARKYLHMLSKTVLYRRFANELLANLDKGLVPEEMVMTRKLAATKDIFFHQNDWTESLTAVVSSNPVNKTALDYLLCQYLLGKNIRSFEGIYEKYYEPRFREALGIPEIYQQALLVNVDSQEEFNYRCSRYGISPEVARRWMDFTKLISQKAVSPADLAAFKGTYWFYIATTQIVNND